MVLQLSKTSLDLDAADVALLVGVITAAALFVLLFLRDGDKRRGGVRSKHEAKKMNILKNSRRDSAIEGHRA